MQQVQSRFGVPQLAPDGLQCDRADTAAFPSSREPTCVSTSSKTSGSPLESTCQPVCELIAVQETQQCPDSPVNSSPRKLVGTRQSNPKVESQVHMEVADHEGLRRKVAILTAVVAFLGLMFLIDITAGWVAAENTKDFRPNENGVLVLSATNRILQTAEAHEPKPLGMVPGMSEEVLEDFLNFRVRIVSEGHATNVFRRVQGVDITEHAAGATARIYAVGGDMLDIESLTNGKLTLANGGVHNVCIACVGARCNAPAEYTDKVLEMLGAQDDAQPCAQLARHIGGAARGRTMRPLLQDRYNSLSVGEFNKR